MDAVLTRSHGRAVTARVLLHVVLPLVLGTLAYAAWRGADVRIVTWMSRIAPHGVGALQGAGASRVPGVIIGSFPDAAWAWAFGASLSLVWRGPAWREKAPWLAAGALVALLTEVCQAVGLVPGTFDVGDLVAIALGFVGGAALAGRAPTAA